MLPIDREPDDEDDFLLVFPSEAPEASTPPLAQHSTPPLSPVPVARIPKSGSPEVKRAVPPVVYKPIVPDDRWRVVTAHALGLVSAHRQAIRMSVALVGSAALGSAATFMVMSRTPTEPTRAVETTSTPSPDQVPVLISARSAPTPVAAAVPASPPAAMSAPAARPASSSVATRVAPARVEPSKPAPPPAAPTPPPIVQRVTASNQMPSPAIPTEAASPRREAAAVNASARVSPPRAERAAPLPALRGVLVVTSAPPGAQVYVNGVLSGVTPLRLQDLAAGSRAVRVELEGYERWSAALRIVANERTTAVAELRPLSGR